MSGLSEADRAIVRDALEELRATPPPRELAPVGCLMALPGFLLVLVVPVAARRFGMEGGLATVALAVGFVLLVAGVALWFAGPRLARGHPVAAAEAALRRLEAWDPEHGDREEVLRAATLLVRNAVVAHGGTRALAVDPGEARRRLGPLVPLVREVERELVAEGQAHPLFSNAPHAEGAGDAGTEGDESPGVQ
ncbi:MAG TPA: hypothetical protein VK849_01570 [Longimicrobiales bacterium]|nr:hypothetical protein [Longimicrobiales bacterium]